MFYSTDYQDDPCTYGWDHDGIALTALINLDTCIDENRNEYFM
jgi:hypothetical protein